MIQTLQDIRLKLINDSYQNEEQVRVGIVTRILCSLGWCIWNPNEVFYEYSVKKFPKIDKNKDENGRVDIALFLTNDNNKTPEVYIETKTINKLTTNFSSFEEQLSRYNYYDRSAISILTDGNIWKFYLSSAGGTFDQRLFNEFNILKDPDDFINRILNEVLHRNNYRQNAITSGQIMLIERCKIQNINAVKDEAENAAKRYSLNKYLIAKNMLASPPYNIEYTQEEIENYWDYKHFNRTELKTDPKNNIKNSTISQNSDVNNNLTNIVNLANFNPNGKKPTKVFVIDQWYDISSWRSLLIKVSELLIERHPDTDLCGYYVANNRWSPKVSIKTIKGKFLHVNFSANVCIKQAIRYLKYHNYDPNTQFKISL